MEKIINFNQSIFENIKHIDEDHANKIHYKVGKEVRNTIKRLGGTMPEDLPTPNKSLKELEKDNKMINRINNMIK